MLSLRIASLVLLECAGLSLAGCTAAVTRGHLVLGPEVEVFRPCGAPEDLWLTGDHAIDEALHKAYERLASQPYEEIYVEVVGEIGPQMDCGFCESYSGSFLVRRVIRLRRSSESDCR